MERYSRHLLMPEIGEIGQDKINKAKVLVIGAGGLGCPVLQYLAAAGVGKLGVVDFDVVDISNLQRQVLFGSSTLGIHKALAAKERLSDLNSDIEIRTYTEELTTKNALDIFKNYDIIVDGTDNFTTRYLVNDACIILGKPLVSASIFKFEGQVSVFNYKNGPSYRCLFPNPPAKGSMPSCSEIGVLGVLPGIIGTLQAGEVLKIILEKGEVLSGKLMLYNALTLEHKVIGFPKNEALIESIKAIDNFENQDYEAFCGLKKTESIIDISDLENLDNYQLIDVRELHEMPRIENTLDLPLSVFEEEYHKISKTQKAVLLCAKGIRSLRAGEILVKHNYPSVYNVKNGISDLLKK